MAKSFAMMMVKVEAREFHLKQARKIYKDLGKGSRKTKPKKST
jgi:hypothetical protein